MMLTVLTFLARASWMTACRYGVVKSKYQLILWPPPVQSKASPRAVLCGLTLRVEVIASQPRCISSEVQSPQSSMPVSGQDAGNKPKQGHASDMGDCWLMIDHCHFASASSISDLTGTDICCRSLIPNGLISDS